MANLNPEINLTIQARMTSTRLPGKVLMSVVGKPVLELMVERLKNVSSINNIIIATTTNIDDNPVEELANNLGIACYRGSEENVLSRVLEAAQKFKTDIIVQTTGDCPLIDSDIVENVIQTYLTNKSDYTSNILERTFPIGMDVQVFSRMVLEDVAERTTNPEDLEHVSSYIYKNPDLYSLYNITAPQSQLDPRLRLTLDTIEDFNLIQIIFETLYPHNNVFSLDNILAFLKEHPELRKINQLVPHNWLQQIKPGE
jgi:spore coat polysaccharide biosynthesis protein SpsF